MYTGGRLRRTSTLLYIDRRWNIRPSNSRRDRTMYFWEMVFYLSYEGLGLAKSRNVLPVGRRRITYPDYESRLLMNE